MRSTSGAERGLAVHRVIELIGQKVPADKACETLGLKPNDPDFQAPASAAPVFIEAVSSRFHPVELHWEVPIIAHDKAGSTINGTIDLLVETDNGYWIVDHKSDETDDRKERFARYWPQLNCYAKALSEGMAMTVAGIAIHWVCYGEISCLTGQI